MFKLTKAIINNINDKNYLKNKDSLKSSKLSTEHSNEMQKIVELEEKNRHENLKIYIKNIAKLRAKQVTLIATPLLLGGLTIASFANAKFTKMKTIDRVCHITTLEFDEEALLSQEETFYARSYSLFGDKINYVDENTKNGFFGDFSSYALLYYGDGSDSLQVKFDINNDNTWQYNSHTNNLYDKSANPHKEAINEVDEQYKELIKEATETFIKQADLSEEEIAYLHEIVSNNENDIIVKLNKCVNLGSMDLEVYKYHWIRCTLAVIADIVLLIFAIKYYYDDPPRQRIIADGSRLIETWCFSPNLFMAASKYSHRQAFLTAEENRINSINSILESNGISDNILSKYEKKLVKKNENKFEMK